MPSFEGAWMWLFPATYLCHIVEEVLAGGGLHSWMRRLTRRTMSVWAFLTLNGALFTLMVCAVMAVRADRLPWLVPALGSLVVVNGLGHLAGTLVTRSYSPGLVTGILLWVPLGLFGLVVSKEHLVLLTWWAGVAAGILTMNLVALTALALSRKSVPE